MAPPDNCFLKCGPLREKFGHLCSTAKYRVKTGSCGSFLCRRAAKRLSNCFNEQIKLHLGMRQTHLGRSTKNSRIILLKIVTFCGRLQIQLTEACCFPLVPLGFRHIKLEFHVGRSYRDLHHPVSSHIKYNSPFIMHASSLTLTLSLFLPRF